MGTGWESEASSPSMSGFPLRPQAGCGARWGARTSRWWTTWQRRMPLSRPELWSRSASRSGRMQQRKTSQRSSFCCCALPGIALHF